MLNTLTNTLKAKLPEVKGIHCEYSAGNQFVSIYFNSCLDDQLENIKNF